MLNLIMQGVEEAIRLTPGLIAELQTLFAKGNVTPEDWAKLRAKVTAKAYEDYVPDTKIPKPAA